MSEIFYLIFWSFLLGVNVLSLRASSKNGSRKHKLGLCALIFLSLLFIIANAAKLAGL